MLLGVALAPFLAWLFSGMAIAAPEAFSGDDGLFYVTGLSPSLKYKISSGGQTISRVANLCGMVKLTPVPGIPFQVMGLGGETIINSSNFATKTPPLCLNGRTYYPKTSGSGFWLYLGYEDNILYAGRFYDGDRNLPLTVENPDLPQEHIFTANACGVVQIKSNNPSFPIDSGDTIADEKGSYEFTALPTLDAKPKCANGSLSPTPTNNQFLTQNTDGSKTLHLAGYRASQRVTIRDTSKTKKIKVKINGCGAIQAKGFSVGGRARIYWPDGTLFTWHDSLVKVQKPVCKNGVFYLPW